MTASRRSRSSSPRPSAPGRSRRRCSLPTPSLRDLQRFFWHALADDPGGRALAPDLLVVVAPSATLDASARLQVYANAYCSRLRDVLAEDFSHVARLLGPEPFADLVRDYLRCHPSEHPSVRHVGRELAGHLARRSDLPPFLADLARLEWARTEVFDARDVDPLSASALRTVPPQAWPRLRFVPIPALAVVRASWPVHEIWGGAEAAAMIAELTVLRVWRAADYTVYHAVTDARAAEALERLVACEPFAVICEAFADLPPAEAAHEATALLARWLEDGIIARAE